MKVICRSNTVSKSDHATKNDRTGEILDSVYEYEELDIGHEYDVFALERWDDNTFRAYVQSIPDCGFPSPYPLELFDISDPEIFSCWCVVFEDQPKGRDIRIISFREWALGDRFYERLVDAQMTATEVYNRWCEKFGLIQR